MVMHLVHALLEPRCNCKLCQRALPALLVLLHSLHTTHMYALPAYVHAYICMYVHAWTIHRAVGCVCTNKLTSLFLFLCPIASAASSVKPSPPDTHVCSWTRRRATAAVAAVVGSTYTHTHAVQEQTAYVRLSSSQNQDSSASTPVCMYACKQWVPDCSKCVHTRTYITMFILCVQCSTL